MKCIIPCAGESSRMSHIPKSLLLINGRPILAHVVDMWKDSVDNFIFVLKRSATYLWEYLPTNSAVVFQDEPKGLADAILRAEPYVSNRFVIALGDCIQSGLFKIPKKEPRLGLGVWEGSSEEELRKSYAVRILGRKIVGVVEKPTKDQRGYCGMGTYFMDPRVFDYIKKTKVTPGGGDFTEVLQAMIDNGEKIHPIYFQGTYINVGSPEDLKKAEKILGG